MRGPIRLLSSYSILPTEAYQKEGRRVTENQAHAPYLVSWAHQQQLMISQIKSYWKSSQRQHAYPNLWAGLTSDSNSVPMLWPVVTSEC